MVKSAIALALIAAYVQAHAGHKHTVRKVYPILQHKYKHDHHDHGVHPGYKHSHGKHGEHTHGADYGFNRDHPSGFKGRDSYGHIETSKSDSEDSDAEPKKWKSLAEFKHAKDLH